MATVETRIEKRRGCGYRKAGGKYLVSSGVGYPCGRMPIACDVCPTCHAGIKPSRGWTWIDLQAFLQNAKECDTTENCGNCPFSILAGVERAGLLWVGEKYYPTPDDFMKEADEMGVSRRISAVPNDFVLGETWVLFAHRKTIEEACPECLGNYAVFDEESDEMTQCEWCEAGVQYQAGVFHAFRPTAVEYVVKGTESEEELDRLEKQGLTLVKVIQDKPSLFDATELEVVQ